MNNLLFDAVTKGKVSQPEMLRTPEGFPFWIAMSRVALKPECEKPDNPMGLRIGVGCGRSNEEAQFLASAEAVERYSLQYGSMSDVICAPIRSTTKKLRSFEWVELTLGAPGTANQITTIGSASRDTLDGAANFAILELLERHFVDAFKRGEAEFYSVDLSKFSSLDSKTDWIAHQFRKLDVRVKPLELGGWVSICACSDLDAGRRTEGSAAGFDLLTTMRKSIQEAMLFWRNMVQLEQNGTNLRNMSGEDILSIKLYRGAEPTPDWPMSAAREWDGPQKPGPESVKVEDLMNYAKSLIGKNIHIFDLTDAALRVPVVKAVID